MDLATSPRIRCAMHAATGSRASLVRHRTHHPLDQMRQTRACDSVRTAADRYERGAPAYTFSTQANQNCHRFIFLSQIER